MKKLSLYVFLLLMFCNTVQALPECGGIHSSRWTNCFGTYINIKVVIKNETFEEEHTYTGEFGSEPGKRHGKGTLTKPDGSEYVGQWKDGKFHGQGTFTYADGTVMKGIWENGELVEPN